MPEGAIGFAIAMMLALFVWMAYDTGRGAAARDCDKLGAFEHNGSIYECRKR
jgi:hypothetical protein